MEISLMDKRKWFNDKLAGVPQQVMAEAKLSSDIVCKIDCIMKRQGMTQRELACRMGRSEAVISRWTTGFPNFTVKTIAELSSALGEPLVNI